MVRIYLDLETYRPKKQDAFVNEKIITCGIIIDETPYQESSLQRVIEPILLSEWDGFDEREIVKKLHDQIKEAFARYRFTVVCGFNILRFDIPLLILKFVQYSLGKHDEITKMWNDCFTIDYFQQLLSANRNLFKGLRSDKIVEISERYNLNPPVHSGDGSVVKEFYEQEEYKKIEEHLEEDLKIVRWLDLYGAKRLIEKSVEEEKALFY